MAKDRQYPSYFTCVAEILSNSKTPVSVDTLVSRIAVKRPVGSGARSAVYQAISKLYQAIPVGGPIAGCGADRRQGQKVAGGDAGVGVGRCPDRTECIQR